MHHALHRGNPLRYFEWLLDHGADPAITDKNGATAFAHAARMARADVLDLFEKRGISLKLDRDDAFLAACARADAKEAQKIAAEDPALVKRLETQNSAVLVDFAGTGKVASVALMLDLGFDIGAKRTSPQWMEGETALHVAAARGLLAMAKLLIDRGAPLEAKRHPSETPLDVALHCLIEQSEWTPNEFTLPIAEMLIKAGAREPERLTLVATLCLGRIDEAERMTQHASEEDRRIALAAAAYNGKLDAIAMLIRFGIDLNAPNSGLEFHAFPLHNAVSSGSLEAVKMLIESGARTDVKDIWFNATPLQWAEYFVKEKKGEKQYAEIVKGLAATDSHG
jgi:ankyrin repeat protein